MCDRCIADAFKTCTTYIILILHYVIFSHGTALLIKRVVKYHILSSCVRIRSLSRYLKIRRQLPISIWYFFPFEKWKRKRPDGYINNNNKRPPQRESTLLLYEFLYLHYYNTVFTDSYILYTREKTLPPSPLRHRQ